MKNLLTRVLVYLGLIISSAIFWTLSILISKGFISG